MLGSEFVQQFAGKGDNAWEAAALQLARAGSLVPWSWVEIPLSDGTNRATVRVQCDVLAIGTLEDRLRLPLTPSAGQNILNLFGWVYPTPWLVYQMYRAAPLKLEPQPIQNRPANLVDFARHSAMIDEQLRAAGAAPNDLRLRSGLKKHVVVSNIWKPDHVVIYGWFRPPPAPDVPDDHQRMGVPGRQPIQPRSNLHGAGFVDYSHGIHAVDGTALVDAPGILQGEIATADLYAHPVLSRLVSNEGPLRRPRYPSAVPAPPVRRYGDVAMRANFHQIPTLPRYGDPGLEALTGRRT